MSLNYSEDRTQQLKELNDIATSIRINLLKSINLAGSGHPGGSLSAADILTALFFYKMKIDPDNPQWEGRDRFILSKGHAAPVLYATLSQRGYFPESELCTLRCLGSRLQGHPDMCKTPGVDMTSGSLGQGLSVGLGMILANRLVQDQVYVYVLLGDGELQEGQVWEAAMASSHYKVQNLVAIVDYNKVQLDDYISEVMEIAPLADKWRAFGWSVLEIDGHEMSQLIDGLDDASIMSKNSPTVIIAHTVKGKGVSFMENKASWHGVSPSQDELESAIKELTGRL